MVTKVIDHVVEYEDGSYVEVLNPETGEVMLKMKVTDLINGFGCGWQTIADLEEEYSKSDPENQ